MLRALPRRWPTGFLAAVVIWQATSFCCWLGGAVAPAMTPLPPSEDLAQQMRERVTQVKSQRGGFTIEVSDRELISYIVTLLQSGPGEFPARDMQIQFGDGYADIWATFIDIAPVDIPIHVRATVEAVDGTLSFSIVQASAGVFPVPGALRETIAQTLSETLDELQLALEIDSVQIQEGQISLSGQVTGDLPDLP